MRAELAADVAAHKPNQLTQPFLYTQRSDDFTVNTLTHIVNVFTKALALVALHHTAAGALDLLT